MLYLLKTNRGCYFIYSKTNPNGDSALEALTDSIESAVDGVQIDPALDTDGDG
jgi:hypothetical protein